MTKAIALMAVLVVTGVLLLVTGVSPGELALFALFELGFVLLPGLTAHAALARDPGGLLARLSIGAAAGHAILLIWFIVTAAAGARWALWLLPPLALAGALVLARRGAWARPAPELTGRQALALAGVAVLALAWVGFAFFTQAPLPGSRASISHYPDLIWAMGIAAEALHHWPVTTPHVLGEPLRYHTFAFMEIAAMSQQTGIDIPTVSLRLFPVSLLLVLVLQLSWAARRFTGNPWSGPIAAALILLVGDLDFAVGRPEPLAGLFFSSLYLSASQLLGMVLFLGTIVVAADLLESDRPSKRSVALLAILLFGCAGAKASLLPVLIGGMVVAAAWRRRFTRGLVVAVGLGALGFIASYALLYSGGRRASVLDPFASSFRSLPGQNLELEIGDSLSRATAYPLATVATAVALLAPLAGLAFTRIDLRKPSPSQAWLLGLFVASVGAFFLVDLPGFSQLYFLWFGYAAAALLSAGGIADAIARGRGSRPAVIGLLGGVGIGALLALGASVGGLPMAKIYMAVGALLALTAIVAAVGRGSRMDPRPVAVFAVSALLTAGLLDAPRDRIPAIASRAVSGSEAVHRQADPPRERGLSADLARGLEWVRDHTDESAVLAVNNHLRRPAIGESRFYYYSALTERRVFIESWDYTDKVLGSAPGTVPNPFPERLALNDAVYGASGRGAAAGLKSRGVTYVLADRVNGPVPPNGGPGRVVFRNDALVVYRL